MENNIERDSESSNSDEEVFRTYFEDLELKPEDFGKKILDIGAGSAQFAKYAKEHGISSQIYSVEPQQDILENEKSVRAVAERLPFADESFDLVISNSAIPNVYNSEKPDDIKNKVSDSFLEIVRVTRLGGEIKLSRVLLGKESESRKILSEGTEEVIEKLEKDGFEIKKIKMPQYDTYRYEGHDPVELLAEAFLVIIKKPEKIVE